MIELLIAVGAILFLDGCSGDNEPAHPKPIDTGTDAINDARSDGASFLDVYNLDTYECGNDYCCVGKDCCVEADATRWFCKDAGSTDTYAPDVAGGDADANIPDPISGEIIESDAGPDITDIIATETQETTTPDITDIIPQDTTGNDGSAATDSMIQNDDGNPTSDECPSDPNKTEPGVCGCGTPDIDTDNDSVMNCLDECPTDPMKSNEGLCGCGVSDIDSDYDGTADCVDLCDDDPEKTAPGVCGCNEPDDDVDADGVVGCNDNCPNDKNPTQTDVDSNGVGDACDPNVKMVLSNIYAADIDTYDIDGDGNDEIIIHGQDQFGSPILTECAVIGADLLCNPNVPFPSDGLAPVSYLPQSYGGLAIATDSADGTPNGIRRFDRASTPVVQNYSFQVVDIGIAEFEPIYPTGIAAYCAKLLISQANCTPTPASSCSVPGMILGFKNQSSWTGIGNQLSPFVPVIDSRKLTALGTSKIEHAICDGAMCNLLVAMSPGSNGVNAGISLHNLDEVEMLVREWIPYSGPSGNVEGYPLPEIDIVQSGYWAIVPMQKPQKGIKAINILTHAQSDTLFNNCISTGSHITDVAVDMDAEPDPIQTSFNVYLVGDDRLIFVNVDKATMSGSIEGYYQLPTTAKRASVAGGKIFAGLNDGRILSIVPDGNLPLTACN